MKMKEMSRNGKLVEALGAMATKERVVESRTLPKEDTVNIDGHKAYSLPDKLRLITMLNTLKIQPQYYRTETEIMKELRDLIEKISLEDPYFVCQAIVYSRCAGEGMRSINHLAATLVSPFIAGKDYAKRFYGAFNTRAYKAGEVRGGTIKRLDDMSEIKDVWAALNTVRVNGKEKMMSLPNAMKKGFASVLEGTDANLLAKYKNTVIDIANLVHPNSKKSKAMTCVDGKEMKMIDALMQGYSVMADTHEAQNSEAGQIVAEAVRQGKLSKSEAVKVLAEAKADNWESLLNDGKLPIMAALRNIRNIMKNPRKNIIDKWCELITNKNLIRQGLILPIHFDLAYDVVMKEFAQADYSPQVQQALINAYEISIPNMKEALSGKTCVIVDCSGSMGGWAISDGKTSANANGGYYWNRAANRTETCAYKAGLIAATIAKATNADIIKFGDSAHYFGYNANENVFSLAKKIGTATDGSTNAYAAFSLLRHNRAKYDRIIFISDNAINGRIETSVGYSEYIHDVCSPYMYAIDLAAYGTTPLKNDGKVSYLFGYGSMLYEDIANNEFDPKYHIDKISKVVI